MKILTRGLKWSASVLLAVILVGFFSIYTVLHTQWGIKRLSSYLSRGTYEITLDSISYSLRTPKQITLHALTLREKSTHSLLLNQATITLNFTPALLWRIGLWDRLHIRHGELNLDLLFFEKQVVTASQLQLENVTIIHSKIPSFSILGTEINGNITPFAQLHPRKIKPITFALTARHLHLGNLAIDNIILSGSIKNDQLVLSNIGGDIGHGFFLANAKRLPDGIWYIDNLQFSHLRLEDPNIIDLLTQAHFFLPKMHFSSINITDSSANLPQLKIERANLELKNADYDGGWRTEGTSVWFDADRVRWNDELFHDPEFLLHIGANTIHIDRASSQWRKGLISFNGSVQNNYWRLNTLTISDVQFILPNQGWEYMDHQWHFLENIANLTIAQLTLKPSIVIDPNPEFPMQFSGLAATVQNIELIRNHQLNIWQGQGRLLADTASLNSIDIRYPEIILSAASASEDQTNIAPKLTFNALIEKGLVEGTLQSNLVSNIIAHLQLTANGVSSRVLIAWQMIHNPPTGDQFSLDLSGTSHPMDLNGILTISGQSSTQKYKIKHNRIVP